MADAEVNFALQAMDEYSGVFDELQDQIDSLSGADVEIGVSADSSGLDEIQNAVDELAGISEIDVPVEVVGDAEATIEEISNDLTALDGATADVTVAVDDQASSILDSLQEKLDGFSLGLGDIGQAAKGLGGDLGTAFGGISGLGETAFIGATGPVGLAIAGGKIAAEVLGGMSGAASEAESAQVRLQLAVEKSGVSWSSVADQTNKYIDALMKATAIDDEKIMATAASLLFMGMNYDTAMRHL